MFTFDASILARIKSHISRPENCSFTPHRAFSISFHISFIVLLYASTLSVVFLGLYPARTTASSARADFSLSLSIPIFLPSLLYDGLVAWKSSCVPVLFVSIFCAVFHTPQSITFPQSLVAHTAKSTGCFAV